jgi:hypothetical protein
MHVGIDPELKTMLEEMLASNKLKLPSDLREEYKELLNRGNFRQSRKPNHEKTSDKVGGHFSTLRTKITDREILIASLRDLGITTKLN